ncbi:MAG: helix-turn-helix domain-containing protein [Oscillospiraceae bacterium]|jgi:transcriptional regulator with XRE-family HTH domain|nr:helix-turn-helix domain-containing protein [Oscillospiraceae bacterium]
MEDTNIIGKRIRLYRKKNALTQEQLADKIGASTLHIANIEQGRKGISLNKLVEICGLFNIGLSDLLPIERQDNTGDKEKWIGEIVGALRGLEAAQVELIKTMVCSLGIGSGI